MAIVKGARGIIRMIKGRPVFIKIKNVKDRAADIGAHRTESRSIIAEAQTDKGKVFVGRLDLTVPISSKIAHLENIKIEKEFRRKGIAKNLFNRASDFLSRADKRFLRSTGIENPAMVKIRAGQGRFKAGAKRKNKSKFFADQFGPYGEHTRRVTSKEAIEIIKQNKSPRSSGRLVTATTMLKRRKK